MVVCEGGILIHYIQHQLTEFWSHLSYRKQVGLFLLPYLVGSLLLVIIPTLATVIIAFTDYHAVGSPVWTGLDNFQRLRASSMIRNSVQHSFTFLALAVPLRLIGALILALLLQRQERLFIAYRAAIYLPTIMPEAAYALIWLWILNPVYGPLNLLLGWVGLPTPAWLAEPVTARLALVMMATFQIGEGLVVVLTGLQSIPQALYEAAKVDGANSWQSFWRITLPLLVPWLLLLALRDLLVSLQNTFTPSFMLTYGGPYYATTFIPLLVYELAFDFFDFGLAAAVLLFVYLLVGLLVLGILNIIGVQGGADAT